MPNALDTSSEGSKTDTVTLEDVLEQRAAANEEKNSHPDDAA
jgi:hypothetical protein